VWDGRMDPCGQRETRRLQRKRGFARGCGLKEEWICAGARADVYE